MVESNRGKPEELFKSPEEELRERGPIFRFEKEVDGEKKPFVSIAGIELEVNQEGEGAFFTEEDFEDFSIDEKSLELLKAMAISMKLDSPLLVEGETDIGKSRAADYISFLTNTRIYRISFSGQTDVTELVGQFIPNTETARETFLRTLSHQEELSEESRVILDRAQEEGRSLTEREAKEIAEREGLDIGEKPEFVWDDGVLPRAMTHNNGEGCLIYFDELGAAEPQILVRINRLFEKRKRLEITEHKGHRIVEAGPNFRIIATTNPPEYAGRNPFAPDFIRRFMYNKESGFTERQIKERIAFVFRGEKANIPPDIYHPAAERPIRLKEAPELSRAVEELLVQFHASAQNALEAGLAKRQKQPFRFEFSDILRVRKYLEGVQTPDIFDTLKRAVELVYISKLSDEPDEKGQSPRDRLRDIFATAAEKLKSPEKIHEAQEFARPEKALEHMEESLKRQKEEMDNLLKRLGLS